MNNTKNLFVMVVTVFVVVMLVVPTLTPMVALGNEESSQCSTTVQTVVSDETATVGVESHAIATNMPSSWAIIPGATWIWNSFFVVQPQQDETVTVTKTFIVDSIPTSGTLSLLADDYFEVSLNGVLLGSDHGERFPVENYSQIIDIQIPSGVLVTGDNTLVVTVLNRGDGVSEFVRGDENPAGTAFSLVVRSQTCVPEVVTPVLLRESTPGTSYVYGCTNPLAENYNSSATSDDNTCHVVISSVSTEMSTSTGMTTPVTGEVLGVSASVNENETPSCGAYLNDYLKIGTKNDKDQVRKLQKFLNTHMGASVPETGYFGSMTKQAVAKFQVKYRSEILTPWESLGKGKELENGTGYVFKTTKHWINILNCASLNEPAPVLP